jgi:hypothetical protein
VNLRVELFQLCLRSQCVKGGGEVEPRCLDRMLGRMAGTSRLGVLTGRLEFDEPGLYNALFPIPAQHIAASLMHILLTQGNLVFARVHGACGIRWAPFYFVRHAHTVPTSVTGMVADISPYLFMIR